MGDFQKADGELAARIGHAFAQARDRECLTRRTAGQQVERAEGAGAIDEIRRGDVAEVRVAKAGREDGAGKLLNLRAPEPIHLRQRQFSATDAGEAGRGSERFHVAGRHAGVSWNKSS